jgi:hypothetical protein
MQIMLCRRQELRCHRSGTHQCLQQQQQIMSIVCSHDAAYSLIVQRLFSPHALHAAAANGWCLDLAGVVGVRKHNYIQRSMLWCHGLSIYHIPVFAEDASTAWCAQSSATVCAR